MEQFNRYMDKIKAQEELKEKTRLFLADKLHQTEVSNNRTYDRRVLAKPRLKLLRSLAAAAAVIFLLFTGLIFYRTPVAYVSLDINPSVEVGINALQRVVRVEVMNEDGQKILQGLTLRNTTLEYAIRMMVEQSLAQGFIAADGSSVISIMSVSGEEEKANRINETLAENIRTFLEEKNVFAVVYTATADAKYREKYHQKDVSSGRFQMIEILRQIDPEIQIDEYKDMKIADIAEKARELSQNNEGIENLDEKAKQEIEEVREVAGQVEQNKVKAEEYKKQQGKDPGEQPDPTAPVPTFVPVTGEQSHDDNHHSAETSKASGNSHQGPSAADSGSSSEEILPSSSDESVVADSQHSSGGQSQGGYSSQPPHPTVQPGQGQSDRSTPGR